MLTFVSILGAQNPELSTFAVFVAFTSAIPIAAPVPAAPFSAAPAAEDRAVNQTIVPILKHSFLSIPTARKDAQRFCMAFIWIYAKRTEVQPEHPVLTRHLL